MQGVPWTLDSSQRSPASGQGQVKGIPVADIVIGDGGLHLESAHLLRQSVGMIDTDA